MIETPGQNFVKKLNEILRLNDNYSGSGPVLNNWQSEKVVQLFDDAAGPAIVVLKKWQKPFMSTADEWDKDINDALQALRSERRQT